MGMRFLKNDLSFRNIFLKKLFNVKLENEKYFVKKILLLKIGNN